LLFNQKDSYLNNVRFVLNNQTRIQEIENRLSELQEEKERLLKELNYIHASNEKVTHYEIMGKPVFETPPTTPEEKTDLFIKLFRCREDVYPKLWENKNKNTQGFSPVCKNEWIRGKCDKPRIKCSDCHNRNFDIFTDQVARSHLEGKIIIGTYAIRTDDTCVFLAADFDKTTWKEDIIAYKNAASQLGVDVAIEISKSGNGAHAWIFFSEPLSARSARQLGTVIMALASRDRYTMSLESYDRFFPNQDTIPKGGFGNLIALPLQKDARENGKTVFVDDSFNQYPDQWKYLSERKRLSLNDLNTILTTVKTGGTLQIELLTNDEEIKNAETVVENVSIHLEPGTFNGRIDFNLGAQLSINIDFLPSKIINAFKRTATFANPKFFELQRLRFSTWNTPRYICCAGIRKSDLILPRGTLETCLNLSKSAGAKAIIKDNRLTLNDIDVSFNGELTSEQEKAVSELLTHDFGILVAPPGIGKTVMACAVIARRKSPTLILVHRKQLMDQWKSQIMRFLNMPAKAIGIIGGNKKKGKGVIDIATLQTLARMENPLEYCNEYEQVIIDECHHIPAVSFESVLNEFPARYFLGLTATPYRKDGLQAIIHMQCGPIRHSMIAVGETTITKKVIIRETKFTMPLESGPQPPIHEVWDKLITDPERLSLIAQDVIKVLTDNRFPLILSERKEHLNLLSEEIKKQASELPITEFIMSGDMGKKARKKALEDIQLALNDSQRPYILSTGSLIGEGFDLPELDTLIIAMPFSFKGRVVQYAGRLHRQISGKTNALIYDYLDINSGLMISMFKKRLTAYREMGYEIDVEDNLKILKFMKQDKKPRKDTSAELFSN